MRNFELDSCDTEEIIKGEDIRCFSECQILIGLGELFTDIFLWTKCCIEGRTMTKFSHRVGSLVICIFFKFSCITVGEPSCLRLTELKSFRLAKYCMTE